MKDPYLYDDVPVLRNLFDSRNADLLNKLERESVSGQLVTIDTILSTNQKIDFDHLRQIHYHLFHKVYDWAGEIRTVPMEKAEEILGWDTVRYTYPKEIVGEVEAYIKKMDGTQWNRMGLEDDKTEALSRNIAGIWKAHPFREGNTRTVITFASHYAIQHGFSLDRGLFSENSGFVRNALVKASDGMYADFQYINKIMGDAIRKGDVAFFAERLRTSGFPPKKKLIQCLMNLNGHFGKDHTLAEIKGLYKNQDTLPKEDREIVNETVEAFQKQERSQTRNRRTPPTPEP